MSAVDLEALRRVDAAPRAPSAVSARTVAWTLALVGAGVAVYFVALPLLRPTRRVMTSAVRLATDGASRAASVAEATGWIEPSPFPTIVKPLVPGVVASMEVLEGQEVVGGKTVIARLRNLEKEAELERAKASVAHKTAHVAEVAAELAEAQAVLDQRIELRTQAVRLAGAAAVAEGDLAVARADAEAARGRLATARATVEAQQRLAREGSGALLLLEQARGELSAAEAEAASKDAAVVRAQAAHGAARAEAEVAKEAVDEPKALRAAVAKYEAHLAAAKVELEMERTHLAIAEREVALLTVVAPEDGVVLRREAAPGTVVGPEVMPTAVGGEMGADSGVGGVVSLYRPSHVQARVLIPLEGASLADVGRAAELSADTVPGKVFHGQVLRVVSEVDVKLPRIEVKVSVDDPDPLLKPGVFVRVRFLAPRPAPGEAAPAARVLVPKAALRSDGKGVASHVFVLDPRGGGRARRVGVERVADEGDWVEVRGDVSATHRVILDPVEDGDAVASGEEMR